MAAVRGSSCAGMGLAPCLPWLRQRDGQEGSRSPLVATGDTSSPKAHPGARCQSTQPSFPATGFVAWHLRTSFHVPATAVGLLISLTLLPPTQPLQQRCGRAIPRLLCLHQRLAQTQLPSPTAPTPRQGAAAAAEPHTWLPCRNLAGLYPLAGARIAPLCKLRALAAAVACYTWCGPGNRPPPLAPASLLLRVSPFHPARTWAKSKTGPRARLPRLNISASSRVRFPLRFAQQRVTHHCTSNSSGKKVSTEVKATRSGFRHTCTMGPASFSR